MAENSVPVKGHFAAPDVCDGCSVSCKVDGHVSVSSEGLRGDKMLLEFF